jgi:hypothetical protein
MTKTETKTGTKSGTKSGKLDGASYETKIDAKGSATVRVTCEYPAGKPTPTAQRVWQIVSDFGGTKTMYPSCLSVYLTYPDNTDAALNTVRHMTFAPPDAKNPLSATNPLPFGIEQLIELDAHARRLTYISALGMPVKNYKSVMEVTGDNACRLTWTSSFTVDKKNQGFVETLAQILAAGANQIAQVLNQV